MKQAQPTYSAYTKEDMDALFGTRPATTNSQAPECPEGYVPYAIEAGDTLRSIAQARGITVNELLFYNPTLSPYGYKKGDVICVPGTAASVATMATSTSSAETAADAGTSASDSTTQGSSTAASDSGASTGGSTASDSGTATTTNDDVTAAPGPGPLPLPTPSLPAGDSDVDPETPAAPGPGPLPLPTPSLPSTPSTPSIPSTPVRPSVPTTPTCENGTLYTVRPGDTLRRIAQGFGVTLEALMEANPGNTNNRLVIGQKLCIPCVPCTTGCASGTSAIRINSTNFADYLVNYNVSYAALAAANPQTDLTNLTVGRTLCIPPAGSRGSCSGGVGTQELQSDTTAAMLADSLGVTVASLLRYNPTFTPLDFRKGRLICVPPQN